AVQSLTTAILPGCRCETAPDLAGLITRLTREPRVPLILCLRPREHVYLFYALLKELRSHPALVISDELFFSDRLILSAWGQLPCMTHPRLSGMISSLRLCELSAPPRAYYPERTPLTDFLDKPPRPVIPADTPPDCPLAACLMDFLSLFMYQTLLSCGLTPFRIRLLRAIWSGHQNQETLGTLLNVHPRKIWNDKHRLLTQLDMKGSLREVIYGTRFCDFLQRTPFMSPAEAEQLRRAARTKTAPAPHAPGLTRKTG
ncbi:hypothetical protein DOA20_25900, partial [Salmonella enterica subsp. enterica serovar Newport]|nr:hypothetical protein [Salmonella enterica subsp. enterica serovar Newport]